MKPEKFTASVGEGDGVIAGCVVADTDLSWATQKKGEESLDWR